MNVGFARVLHFIWCKKMKKSWSWKNLHLINCQHHEYKLYAITVATHDDRHFPSSGKKDLRLIWICASSVLPPARQSGVCAATT